MKDNLENILESSFLDYSAFVLQRRALPDARDGMKYTARQIIHAQYKDKLDCSHAFKKSQKSVSAATSFSYVHGDTSAYEQIIRMGRPLVQRYFLEQINGNGGTPTGSSTYSAPRYTEARLSEMADVVFKYLNHDVLDDKDWSPTYDEEGVFPTVLPSVGFYNLCNGSFGSIGVGLISSIPQFNIREMNEAICQLIDDPTSEVQLYPDFASGGILLNPQTTLASLARGEGKSALIRGKLSIDPKGKYIDVIELPYGVYTNTVCIELEKALDKGKPPFTSFKDLSKRSVQLRIYTDNVGELEKWLYKNTSVQKHFTIKLIMLKNGKTPHLFSITEALKAHIAHAKTVFERQYLYQLRVLRDRQEILNGLIRAYSILDDIIALIKASSGRADAIQQMVTKFQFTQRQAEAIADLRLHRLSNLDIKNLENELEGNLQEQEGIHDILDTPEKFDLELKKIYEEVGRKFGDKRRTEICTVDAWETEQDGGKATKDFYLSPHAAGYVAAYNKEDELMLDEEKANISYIECDQDYIIVTNQVRGFLRKGSEFVIGQVKWEDVIKLNPDEFVQFVIPKTDLENYEFVEFDCADGSRWSVHVSFITSGASKRGKKLVNGKYNVTNYEFQETSTSCPKMR